MKNTKQPTRTCIACRKQNDKKNLLRIVKTEDGVVIDKLGKLSGRGAYICNDINCLEKCIKSKALNRAFSTEIKPDVYERLKESFFAGYNK